jgi:hypothetical protein
MSLTDRLMRVLSVFLLARPVPCCAATIHWASYR